VSRPSAGRALALVALTWGVAVGCILTVAADTRIGPVVFRLTEKHGVHLGDLYAALGCAGVALLITVWIIVDHAGRKRRWARAQRRAARDRRAVHEQPAESEEDGEPYADGYAEAYSEYGHDEYGYDEQYDEYLDDEGHHALQGAPDPDLAETVLIERDTGDYTGRHRPPG
jgi:hypothetical protein